ncbi:hypothetical protein G5I_00170 [Acromyrmex echinatior]|uniref:Uncharacterized protein n=1 Tax=Acromyrmex echinatior TaxID=103372 RepID=F4W465_ACREC|nr:hypothetical protein G5I_00170 [Acromyrmex echinatior]
MRGRSYVSRRRRWRRRRRRSSTQHPTHSRFSGRLNAFGVCQAAAPSSLPPPAAQWPHLPPPPLAPLLTKRRAASRLVSSPRRTRRASRVIVKHRERTFDLVSLVALNANRFLWKFIQDLSASTAAGGYLLEGSLRSRLATPGLSYLRVVGAGPPFPLRRSFPFFHVAAFLVALSHVVFSSLQRGVTSASTILPPPPPSVSPPSDP